MGEEELQWVNRGEKEEKGDWLVNGGAINNQICVIIRVSTRPRTCGLDDLP